MPWKIGLFQSGICAASLVLEIANRQPYQLVEWAVTRELLTWQLPFLNSELRAELQFTGLECELNILGRRLRLLLEVRFDDGFEQGDMDWRGEIRETRQAMKLVDSRYMSRLQKPYKFIYLQITLSPAGWQTSAQPNSRQ